MFSLLLQSEIKIDINNATYEELSLIPIDSQKIIKIQKYINNFGKISTIHEILNLEDISANDFEILKKHIYINDDFSEKQYSYRLNWLLNDDASGDNNLSNNKGVLVHCKAGMQRSATIVALYLMKKFNMNFDKVKEIIRNKRQIVFRPFTNFIEPILYFQNKFNNIK